MALHRDFMMRMIEKLAAAFFRILAGKAAEDPEQALLDIEDLLAEALGTSRDFALGQGPAAIDTVEPPLAAELARLLLLHGKLSDGLGQMDRANRARRMGFRAIERTLERPNTEFAEMAAEQLHEHLRALETCIPADDLAGACMAAHKTAFAHDAYSDAEDWLFFAMEFGASAERIAAGERFYGALSKLSEAELVEGGLSHVEVRESHAELAALKQ